MCACERELMVSASTAHRACSDETNTREHKKRVLRKREKKSERTSSSRERDKSRFAFCLTAPADVSLFRRRSAKTSFFFLPRIRGKRSPLYPPQFLCAFTVVRRRKREKERETIRRRSEYDAVHDLLFALYTYTTYTTGEGFFLKP